MTLTQLIERLTKLRDAHGDLPLVKSDDYGNWRAVSPSLAPVRLSEVNQYSTGSTSLVFQCYPHPKGANVAPTHVEISA